MKSRFKILFAVIVIISLSLYFSCKSQKHISDNIYFFKNQRLNVLRMFDFKHPDAKEDSTIMVYYNEENIAFQFRVLKSDKLKTFEMMDSIDKCSFRAKKREKRKDSYIIQIESLEY